MKAFGEAVIALVGVLLTSIFEYVKMEVVAPEEAKKLLVSTNRLMEALAIHFDLWLIALSLIVGAYFTSRATGKGASLVPPSFGLMAVLLVMLALFLPSRQFSDPHYLLRVWFPDALGFAIVAWSIIAAKSVHSEKGQP
jgi:hypothetical protein